MQRSFKMYDLDLDLTFNIHSNPSLYDFQWKLQNRIQLMGKIERYYKTLKQL